MTSLLKQQQQVGALESAHRIPGILIADDMALILTLLKIELEIRGFKVWLAVDGDDALDLYRTHSGEINLVLLDVHMPGMDGPNTLEALQRFNPDVVACFMTGNAGAYTDEELLERGAAWVFRKPFRAAEVADMLYEMASHPVATQFVCDWQAPLRREPQPYLRRGNRKSTPR
jgi:CheY-like chemotaxis protein